MSSASCAAGLLSGGIIFGAALSVFVCAVVSTGSCPSWETGYHPARDRADDAALKETFAGFNYTSRLYI